MNKKLIKSDLKKLDALARLIASLYKNTYKMPEVIWYFEVMKSQDGRKLKSKKFQDIKEYLKNAKNSRFSIHNEARKIYFNWKYVNYSSVDGGRYFQRLIDGYMRSNKNIQSKLF